MPRSTTTKADKVAKLPRGGGILGTPVEFKHLATLYYSFYALNGVTAMPAPEASATTFPELRDKDSPGYVIYEHLGAISLSETDTHITNVVYWRPPGNRVPTPQETLICRPFLERQIRLVRPELIVTVGGAAAIFPDAD